MSESVKDLRLSKAKEILDEALAACDRLNRMPTEILSELAANRLKWPVALVGSGGLTARGIKAVDYVSGIGLGSCIPVNAKNPNSELKLIVFEFIDFVHRAKENEGTEKPAPPPPAELIEMGLEDEYYKQQEEEWQREREARKRRRESPPAWRRALGRSSIFIVDEIYLWCLVWQSPNRFS